ncbi:hypothetical protein [Rhizorhabdus dicambivorans]|uniref:Cobalt transporter n=1 Tax=Rhizorhabdus dicambivorans TaxID=1850238 RepID=A0A2A4FVR8_9SPHN|nr:hypothetical protein [Rhizorhabdus dicambivorans]ATE63746.1 hypothetical protein CMV14_04500 [Rhizorhabdus dicambivorans]PCE42876.1 hypothetical protein COO09_08635 [Rhizorhabdus dicambivorans]
MRRLWPLLIIFAVLCCGLHVGEADTAHVAIEHHQLASDDPAAADNGDDRPELPGKIADAGHHHCPVAPDQAPPLLLCRAAPVALLTSRPVAILSSLALAPPVEPPSA